VDERLAFRQATNLRFQLLDLGTLLADHDSRAGRIDVDFGFVRGTLDLNLGNTGVVQAFLEELPQAQVLVQQLRVLTPREPTRVPLFDDAQPKPFWMYLLAHASSSLPLGTFVDHDCDVAGALAQRRGATVRPRQEALQCAAAGDRNALHVQAIHVDAGRLLGVGDDRLEGLGDQARRVLRCKVQEHERFADTLSADHVDHEACLAGGDAKMSTNGVRFHHEAFAGAGGGGAAGFASALRSPECPWNVRVGENSPSLCPTMFSETN